MRSMLMFAACAALLVTTALGQSPDESFLEMTLEELLDVDVTSVSKTKKSILDAPVMAHVVTRPMIEQRGYRDLLDVLADLPGVYLVHLANSEHAGSDIFVRGIHANTKLIILVDGHKINPPTGEPFTFLYNIPLVAVHQVEFSYGSSSSLYGADAMAGIVNIVTVSETEGVPNRGDVTIGRHATRELQMAIGHQFSNDVTLSLSGKFYESKVEDLPLHFPDEYSGYDVDLSQESHNVHAKGGYRGLRFSYYRLYGCRNNALGFLPSLYDYSGVSVWKTLNQFYTLDWEIGLAPNWNTKTVICHSSTELKDPSTYTTDFSGKGDYTPHHFFWEGTSSKFAQELLYRRDRLCWISGAEIEYFSSKPKTELNNPLGRYDIDYRNQAAFSQVEYLPVENLELTGGLRYDYNSRYSSEWNPRLGASFKPTPGIRLRGNWGTSYLAPAPHKVYERWGVIEEGEFVHLPNEDLQPEELASYELACAVFPSGCLFFELAGFYIEGKDLTRIAFKGPITIDGKNLNYQTNENVAESEIRGLHAVADYRVTPRFQLDGHYTYTTGRQDAADVTAGKVDLIHMPKHLLRGSATVTHPWVKARLTSNWFDTITTHERNSSYQGGRVDGTWTFDLALSNRSAIGPTTMAVGLTVKNLFDRKYYKVPRVDEFFFSLAEVPQHRRTVFFTLGAEF